MGKYFFFWEFPKWNSITIQHCLSLLLWELGWTVHRGIPWARRILTDYCHINPMYNDGTEVRKIIRWCCQLNNLAFLLKEKSETSHCFPRRHWIIQKILKLILEGYFSFYKTVTASHGRNYWRLSPTLCPGPIKRTYPMHWISRLQRRIPKILPPSTCMIILCIYVFH